MYMLPLKQPETAGTELHYMPIQPCTCNRLLGNISSTTQHNWLLRSQQPGMSPAQAQQLDGASAGMQDGALPGDRMKMMGVVLLLSFLTDCSVTGPGSANWGPRLEMTYCWTAATRQSGRTSFSRHSFCMGLMLLPPCTPCKPYKHTIVHSRTQNIEVAGSLAILLQMLQSSGCASLRRLHSQGACTKIQSASEWQGHVLLLIQVTLLAHASWTQASVKYMWIYACQSP